MIPAPRRAVIYCLCILAVSVAPAAAGSLASEASSYYGPIVGAAIVLPALEKTRDGHVEAARRANALIVSTVVTTLLKETVHEWRPDHSNTNSFPSGHTSAAFALAGTLSKEHPKNKWLYIGLASVVGWSRVAQGRHHWLDVVAGAGIGYASGRWAAERRSGVLLGPTIRW